MTLERRKILMVSVKICSGTACYIMGGAELLAVANELDPEELDHVAIEASSCLGVCNDYGPKTPFVRVNDKVLAHATLETLLEKIRQAIAKEEVSND